MIIVDEVTVHYNKGKGFKLGSTDCPTYSMHPREGSGDLEITKVQFFITVKPSLEDIKILLEQRDRADRGRKIGVFGSGAGIKAGAPITGISEGLFCVILISDTTGERIEVGFISISRSHKRSEPAPVLASAPLGPVPTSVSTHTGTQVTSALEPLQEPVESDAEAMRRILLQALASLSLAENSADSTAKRIRVEPLGHSDIQGLRDTSFAKALEYGFDMTKPWERVIELDGTQVILTTEFVVHTFMDGWAAYQDWAKDQHADFGKYTRAKAKIHDPAFPGFSITHKGKVGEPMESVVEEAKALYCKKKMIVDVFPVPEEVD